MTNNNRRILFVSLISILSAVLVVSYRYGPYRVSFLGHYDKIWAHRVNSVQKLSSALHYFNGVELDLVYINSKNSFDVNHPPSESIDLTFENYLSNINIDNQPFLWLDIKNLTSENSEKIKLKLSSLFKEAKFPFDKVLIESGSIEALPTFTERGLKTSLNLTLQLANLDSINFDKKLNYLDSILEQNPEIGVSASHKDYELINSHFPTKNKYIWILNHSKIKEHGLVRSILKNDKVKVVLTPYRPISGNR